MALVAFVLAAAFFPLPDGTSIDGFSYRFIAGPAGLAPAGSLAVLADGTVQYSHATAPSTGSGGKITKKKWELTKAEAAELLRELVAAGLLELPGAKESVHNREWFTVTSGRWQFTFAVERVPEKVMALLRPLLAKAHPELWAEKPAKAEPGGPKLTRFVYSYAPKVIGDSAVLAVSRDGTVTYKRVTDPNAPGGLKVRAEDKWTIPAKDAEALLDALVADGLFDLPDTLGGKFPNHHVAAHSGRWHTALFPKEMPEKLMKHFLPLLKKADPEFWK